MFNNHLFILIGVIIISFLIGLAVYAIIQATQNKKSHKHTIIGGCLATRWGCCPDMVTPKYDEAGTNCIPTPYPQEHGWPNPLSSSQTQNLPSQTPPTSH